MKGQILGFRKCGNFIIGECTSITLYPGDDVWFHMKANSLIAGEKVVALRDSDEFTDPLRVGGGFFSFEKNKIFDLTEV